MPAPIAGSDAVRRLGEQFATWADRWPGATLLGVDLVDGESGRWLVRLRGEEKDVIAIWFTLRQRTVHLECEVTPAPEENLEQLYRYLLVKNAGLHQVHLAIGPEQGVYLTGAVPVAELDAESLDELIGEVVTRVDEIFPTAMSMGHASLYRRRPRR